VQEGVVLEHVGADAEPLAVHPRLLRGRHGGGAREGRAHGGGAGALAGGGGGAGEGGGRLIEAVRVVGGGRVGRRVVLLLLLLLGLAAELHAHVWRVAEAGYRGIGIKSRGRHVLDVVVEGKVVAVVVGVGHIEDGVGFVVEKEIANKAVVNGCHWGVLYRERR
jgi:hypothetical protein